MGRRHEFGWNIGSGQNEWNLREGWPELKGFKPKEVVVDRNALTLCTNTHGWGAGFRPTPTPNTAR